MASSIETEPDDMGECDIWIKGWYTTDYDMGK